MSVRIVTDDLARLTAVLPPLLQEAVARLPGGELLEVVLDLGRRPQARLVDGAVDLADQAVDRATLDRVVDGVGRFGPDNRAGIEGTLHRIACLRNRRGDVVGLTLRVGRAVIGTVDLIREYVERGGSLLLLGRPGVGKTTKLREIARLLADEAGRRVVIVDTSNEIGGDGDVPHPAVGSARRMQVPRPDRQHAVMIEAVENHMPEVVVIDEIGTADEALAARTIAERGVQLIATAHGNTLDNLLMNPTLSDLVGGVQTVVLGDDEARLRGTQKTVRERRTTPTFGTLVEIQDRDRFVVHPDTAGAVDRLLRGESAHGARIGAVAAVVPPPPTRTAAPRRLQPPAGDRPLRIHPWAISRDSVERVIRDLHLNARTVRTPEHADLIVALHSRSDDPHLRRLVEESGVPLREVKRNTTAQIRRSLQQAIAEACADDAAPWQAPEWPGDELRR
jgi:stage III sporulation protein SpoIIIAA